MENNGLLKGKPVADSLTEELIKKTQELNKRNIFPKLAMVRVGNREDDLSYQKAASNRCSKCGILTEIVELDENCSQDEYINTLKNLNDDISVNGILCFRPLPKSLDEKKIAETISPEKDVDCFSPENIARLVMGEKCFPPCTPEGVMEILNYYDVDVQGKKVVILGRSLLVGKPLSMLLLNKNATVTICHSKTEAIENISKGADILVSCMGKLKMVDKKYIGEGSTVIDVGINFDNDGNMFGDVNFEDIRDIVGKITPVPGGVGSVTTSILAKHVLETCIKQNS
ncbi:bifunctional 5,10-methylenetetrahydrofolate dehydrogenase/5,10-methenyltetrahydrofolate cyclohydrolase [Peptostreptococcus canis]|uniref:Bifunctional protein FolD n=1 Tax=Peptostreptococcus canis TaxID=1159213 RepID=A0ABR6TIW5_9FIRM|nr:bifunctional 5,10-methylenetetrahydrofolate dehydrogenase/5,10-methenyltetrahydrofolate cyclohydrolase [Peptostreptococcus canis]MBC2575356.1 bifunctional 5,10-methylenetetrahydrofolate dehydrogenase/5,10-methenyltetrahydrofolate cyclohydrolase [Peptostreptococcus canis]MBP1997461.1 methylenetetrahydrofolate dehydrogenase (NADP+)/methenyltetrahydrofolate cyclohydrolase [Peptostreptococcus canis]